jgi:topoisomerase-4 subunit B
MPGLIENGHLHLAQPPLYRLVSGETRIYARDDAHKEELLATTFKNKKVEISRFKGLGEMPPADLKVTTMDAASRTLLRVGQRDERTPDLVESLMGRKPELRYNFIQDNAQFAHDLDI